MEITKEIIEEQKLTEEQVTAINGFGKTHTDTLIADTKKEYDGKANADAEAILNGAATKITEVTGVEREQGQKIADFINSAWGGFSTTKTAELDKAKADYEQKLKDFKGDDATKAELDKARTSLDALQKKTADYDTLKETAGKHDTLLESHNTLKINQSFTSVKPVFAKTINEYEAKSKWDSFMAGVLDKNTIEIVEGEAIAIDKDNPHKQTKLKDLVSADENIKAMTEGRQQKGTGAKESELETIEGVPFEVPVDATSADRQTLIKDYLAKKGITNMSAEYPAMFAELNNKMLQRTAKAN